MSTPPPPPSARPPGPPSPPPYRPSAAARAEALFDAALDLPEAERERFVAAECAGDEGLGQRVRTLLAAHAAAPDFLEEAPNSPEIEEQIARLKPEEAGERIGPYKLLQEIGVGGFGTVWMADQEQPVRRRVALKIIKVGMDTKEVIKRFEQERQALAMMDHPNIARVIDAGATQYGRPFFVMELVRGVKITDYCDEQGLSTAERIELFILVCQAVQHAHQKGIIHRDLKPSNILVTINDGEAVPKVIDFGVAKATQGRLTEGTLFTKFEQMIGTPLYMSPEQAEMTSLDVDTRSDIYALGVLLYELLTGRTPIDTETMAKAGMDEIRRLIREVDPPRPSLRLKTLDGNELTAMAKRRHTEVAKLPSSLRGDIDWIVMKCLEKDRKRRYDTANGLALDLQRHLKNEVVIARPPTAAYLLGKLMRRHKLAVAAGAAIAASLVVGIAASLWQARRAMAALDELRATAPTFAEQARALVAKERFEEALEKLAYATKLRPDVPEYLIAKGDVLRCQPHLAEAASAYRAALVLRPGDVYARENAALCDKLLSAPLGEGGKLSRESLSRLHVAMQHQQRPAAELMPVARLLGEEKKLILDYWLGRLKDLPISAERPLEKRMIVRDDGWLALDLSHTRIADLSPLAGAPLGALDLSDADEVTDLSSLRGMQTLRSLDLGGTKVSDLSPLRDLKLRQLILDRSQVTDLAPLRGIPLEQLSLHETRVADIFPLRGMPLRTIDLTAAPVLDFSPLAGLPLQDCIMQNNRVGDLSFLHGMPLRRLVLWGCVEARNYAVIPEIKTLELVLLPSQYRSLPADDLAAVASLRDHPRLRQLGSEIMNGMSYDATGAKEVFWHDWDREQTFVPELRKRGIQFTLLKLPTGTYALRIENQALGDISFLKDAPISELAIDWCKVNDLTPIQNLPLRYLSLSGNPVSDLSALRKMPLQELYLISTKVSDLTPLKGLPLKSLFLDGSDGITDVTPLAEVPSLETLVVPPAAKGVEALRKLPGLQRLAYNRSDTPPYGPVSTAEDFWKTWSDLLWLRALAASGLNYMARQHSDGTWSVTINTPAFRDCSIFKGSQIRELTLDGTSVTDLAPLAGLPLQHLSLDRTSVSDLTPLAGCALTTLSLRETKVVDLSVLRQPALCSSLEKIWLYRVKVSDFSPVAACTALTTFDATETSLRELEPVKGRRLREIYVASTQINDISLLAEMPLEVIFFDNTAVADLAPLLKCPTLKRIILPTSAQNIETLRQLPRLERIAHTYDGKLGGPSTTAAEFWRDYEANHVWRTRLRDTGLKIKTLKPVGDDTWEVNLEGSEVCDLTILKGMPISILWLGNTAVTDLSPLRGMGLKRLFLYNTKITDLSPLQGMPIEKLDLRRTKVTDISVLRGMPLVYLLLHDCTEVVDVSSIEGTNTLKEVTLPPNAKNFEFLRTLPKLERIGYTENSTWNPDKTAVEFWKEYDAKKN